jgi:proton-translocating NADH-quinone oxidoreductase chain L
MNLINTASMLTACVTAPYTNAEMLYDTINDIVCNYCTGVIFFPFIGFFCSAFFGNKIGTKGAQFLTVFFMSLSFLLSCCLFFIINLYGTTYQKILGSWVIFDYLIINWQFLFDPLTCVMLIIINIISLCVHIYSIDYMKKDPHICRFMAYLSLFTFCMNILVTSGNLAQLFIGWEGVGLCSYLLINFWFTRIQANKAALKALFVNKIGDLALLIALTLLGLFGYSLNFDILFLSISFFEKINISFFNYNIKILDLICFFLVIAAIGKSAQIGLHTWLPDAMEGPTPVSALIHAATMVTAGIFLLVRFSPILEYSPKILFFITIIGALTSFIAATIGLFQNDIKKIIAYSTCSQLGYMMFACGNSCYHVAMFHLFTHAFFKALLFLTAGAIIHSLNDEQDIRKYGGLAKVLPISFACILIGSLSLMGFPFLAGFYSKDIILETSYATYTISGHFAYWLGCFAAFCTSFYSVRLILLTFLIKTNSFKKTIENIHESSIFILIPLIFLSFCSIFVGFFF